MSSFILDPSSFDIPNPGLQIGFWAFFICTTYPSFQALQRKVRSTRANIQPRIYA